MSKNRTDRRDSGFTLIEVTVALAIAALGLGVLMTAAGTGLGQANFADQTIEATRRAQSHLAELGVLTPLRPGVQSGDAGGDYSWRSWISAPAMHARGEGGLGLYTVEVTVTWHTGMATRNVTLRSQRLARVTNDNE